MKRSRQHSDSAIFWHHSQENCLDALVAAANAERFYVLRKGKSRFYWKLKRKAIASFYISNYGLLPEMFMGNTMKLGRTKQNNNQEFMCRQFMRRNQVGK
jgi:hypothetical protein